MGLGQGYQQQYGLSPGEVGSARQRAKISTGLALLGAAGTQGIGAIPQALLGGLGVYDQEAAKAYEVKRQRDQDAQEQSYRDSLMERSRALSEAQKRELDIKDQATADARARARELRDLLAGTPYATEAAFADLSRLEKLTDHYYADEAKKRAPVDPTIRSVDGYGKTTFVDPITGKVLSSFAHPEKPDAAGAAGDKYMPTNERQLRHQIMTEISAEITRSRKAHFETVGPNLDNTSLPSVPYPADLERKATERALSRYNVDELPASLRQSFAAEGVMGAASPERRRQVEAVTNVVFELTQRGRSDLAKAVEGPGLQDLLDALAAGYTVDQIVAEMLRAPR